jgi:hypothetical protein
MPISSSWLNLVERWSGKITAEHIRGGVSTGVPQLERAIHAYIERNNANPNPFVWTKSTNVVAEALKKGPAVLDPALADAAAAPVRAHIEDLVERGFVGTEGAAALGALYRRT